jgi:hypothetical protein
MFLYKKLKLNLEREFYLSYINSDIRRGFTKIRIRDHNLEIEKGRYCKIPRILRLYKTCYKIEDEEHFILECTINSKLRTDLFAILANENPNFMQFLNIIIILLSNKHPYMFVTRKKQKQKTKN